MENFGWLVGCLVGSVSFGLIQTQTETPKKIKYLVQLPKAFINYSLQKRVLLKISILLIINKEISSANGQFGGFHVLAIQSSVAMALRFMCLSPQRVHQVYAQEWDYRSCGSSRFVFKGTSIMSFAMALTRLHSHPEHTRDLFHHAVPKISACRLFFFFTHTQKKPRLSTLGFCLFSY